MLARPQRKLKPTPPRSSRRAQLCLLWLTLLPALAACANHVRFVEFETKERKTDRIERHSVIQNPPPILEEPKVDLDFLDERRIESRVEVTLTKVEERVPWSGWREFYEVPTGLISVPLSMVFNLFGGVLPGFIPAHAVRSYTHWTFAAANPFLNTESKGRIVRVPIDVTTHDTDPKNDAVQSPHGNAPIEVHFDQQPPVRLLTDEAGHLSFHLLDLCERALHEPPRKLILSLPRKDAEPGSSESEIYLDRDLAHRIFEASRLLPMADSPAVSSARLSQAVYQLERLGFKEFSLQMEDRIYHRFQTNQAFLERFRATLHQRYDAPDSATPVDPPPVGAQGNESMRSSAD